MQPKGPGSLRARAFPPQFIYTEAQRGKDELASVTSLFGRAFVVWAPESGGRPETSVHFMRPLVYSTTQKVQSRVVQGVDAKLYLLYVKFSALDGLTSPGGLATTMANIRRRRQTRYFKICSLFSDQISRLRDTNPAYLASSLHHAQGSVSEVPCLLSK
ncbi:hypothetical protein GQ600_2871 [Phytophthora cactorum]|nr:hypothetical protein GQ600_2871 [Phytophthora cactorum]